MRSDLKRKLIAQAVAGKGVVFTDPVASPTGFPFKVAQLEGTTSAFKIYQERKRVCDLGYLRDPYTAENGTIGYRCSAEPVANYLAKGGKIEDTVGKKCLCNSLMANVGHAQIRKGSVAEPPLVTVGDDLNTVATFLAPGRESYSAADVVESLMRLVPMEKEAAEPIAAMSAVQALQQVLSREPLLGMEPIMATA
jgi:nitronate monooxygenase